VATLLCMAVEPSAVDGGRCAGLEAAGEAPALATKRVRRLPMRRGGGRHRLTVRVTDEEWVDLRERAEAAGVTVARFLVETATRAGDRTTVAQVTFLVRELQRAQRQVRGAATNLNQLAHVANGSGRLPAEVPEAAARMVETVEALEVAVDRLRL
jgi:uncharacterized protein (DUF1778 family)